MHRGQHGPWDKSDMHVAFEEPREIREGFQEEVMSACESIGKEKERE